MEPSRGLWLVLDSLLFAFHLFVIGVNVFGWIPRRMRALQRSILLLTTLSWLGLGYFYGLGYCFLTDWHWEIKRQLGEQNVPSSFIQYILRQKLGWQLPDLMVDRITGTVFALLLIITLGQLVREHRRKSKAEPSSLDQDS